MNQIKNIKQAAKPNMDKQYYAPSKAEWANAEEDDCFRNVDLEDDDCF